MQPQSHSTSLNTASGSRSLLLPNPAAVVLYVVISAIALVALNVRALWRYYHQYVLLTPENASHIGTLKGTDQLFAQLSTSRLPLLFFWLFVGCSAYIVVWFGRNIYLNIRNDFVADHFVAPRNYDHHRFWEGVLARKIFFVLSLLFFMTYLLEASRVLSLLSGYTYVAITDFTLLSSSIQLFTFVLAGALLCHILVVLGTTTMRCLKSVYRDL